MQTTQSQRLERFVNVVRFCGGSEERLASISVGYRKQLQVLRKAVAALQDGVAAERTARASVPVERLRRARRALHQHLVSLRRMARVMNAGSERPVPTIGVPHRDSSLTALLHAGRQAVRDVTAHRDAFVAYGMPADTPEQLAAAVRVVELLRDEGVAVRSQLTRIRGEREAAFRMGSGAVLCLDVMIRMYHHRHPAGTAVPLQRWEEVIGRQRAPGRRRVSAC